MTMFVVAWTFVLSYAQKDVVDRNVENLRFQAVA